MIVRNRVWRRAALPVTRWRWLSASALERRLPEPVQSYISTSNDPYLNLSIEHHFLQKSSPESAILFLYVNRPSIIIGRNQNPWFEVNLALLNAAHKRLETEPPGVGVVDLVRRRSGGGTVFHDEGNVNWTVICPSAIFTRDKHAEMVTRALRSCGVDRSRVNERHDIVLDQGERCRDIDTEDTHVTPFKNQDEDGPRPLKVSGSAYKLTRNRALHHGTCLLSSPNLNIIPDYLHSPAKPYITARGVESVSSPVGNILLSNEEFEAAVQKNFLEMYAAKQIRVSEVGLEMLEVDNIQKGYKELKSLEWTYLQTPQFIVSNASDANAPMQVDFTFRHGAMTSGSVTPRATAGSTLELNDSGLGLKLHEIDSWRDALNSSSSSLKPEHRDYLVNWLHEILPPVYTSEGLE